MQGWGAGGWVLKNKHQPKIDPIPVGFFLKVKHGEWVTRKNNQVIETMQTLAFRRTASEDWKVKLKVPMTPLGAFNSQIRKSSTMKLWDKAVLGFLFQLNVAKTLSLMMLSMSSEKLKKCNAHMTETERGKWKIHWCDEYKNSTAAWKNKYIDATLAATILTHSPRSKVDPALFKSMTPLRNTKDNHFSDKLSGGNERLPRTNPKQHKQACAERVESASWEKKRKKKKKPALWPWSEEEDKRAQSFWEH